MGRASPKGGSCQAAAVDRGRVVQTPDVLMGKFHLVPGSPIGGQVPPMVPNVRTAVVGDVAAARGGHPVSGRGAATPST